MGRGPARPEPPPLQGAPCRLAAAREGQGVVLPTRGDALCALHPDLEEAGGGVRPGGPSPEEDGHPSDSGRCDGEDHGAEERDGGQGVLRVPLCGRCGAGLEAEACEIHLQGSFKLNGPRMGYWGMWL